MGAGWSGGGGVQYDDDNDTNMTPKNESNGLIPGTGFLFFFLIKFIYLFVLLLRT